MSKMNTHKHIDAEHSRHNAGILRCSVCLAQRITDAWNLGQFSGPRVTGTSTENEPPFGTITSAFGILAACAGVIVEAMF